MNNRVNIKFAIILGTIFVLMSSGVAYVAYVRLTTSGDEYALRGENAALAGDYKSASENYGRAVGHDRTRKDWLERWKFMLEHYVPDSDTEFDKNFRQFYTGILTQLAALEITSPEAQRQNLDLLYQRLLWQSASPESWQQLADATSTAIQQLDMTQSEGLSLLRYRGLAIVKQMEQFDPPESVRKQAESDLQSALAGNPQDTDAAFALGRWYLIEWRRARRNRNEDLGAQLLEELENVSTMLKTNFEGQPHAMLSSLELTLNKTLTGAGNFTQRKLAVSSLAGQEDDVLVAFASAPVDQIPSLALDRLVTVLGLMRQQDGFELTIPILERVIAQRPEDIETLIVLGRVHSILQEPRAAITAYQQILDIPNLPIGIDGLLQRGFRILARDSQAESALQLAELAENEDDRAAALGLFHEYRDALAEALPGGSNAAQVLLLDARYSMLVRAYESALTKLSSYQRETSSNANEVLRLQARCYIGVNQLGSARESIESLLLREPDNTQALLLAVEIDRRLGEPRRAIDRLQLALRTDPDNLELQEVLDGVRARMGIAPSDDEVLSTIVQVQKQLRSNPQDTLQADTMYSAMLSKFPDDERAITSYIDYLLATNRIEDAKVFTKQSAADHPDSSEIQRRSLLLEAAGPVQYAVELLDLQEMPEVERLMRKASIYRSNGMFDEAEQEVQAAGEIDPEYSLYIEYRFAEAVDSENEEDIQFFLDKAISTNADNANGAIFSALLHQTRQEHTEAVAILEDVLERMPFSVRAKQMVGRSYLALGRINDAVTSLRSSYDARPDNYTAAKALIDALQQLQQYEEALVIARRTSELNPRNATIRQLRLSLEGRVGDREYAIREHRSILEQLPDNKASRFALIQLLIETHQWDEAKRELVTAATLFGSDDLDYLMQQSRWHAKQGNLSEGLLFLKEHIKADPSDTRSVYLISDYAVEFGLVDEAIAAYEVAMATNKEESLRRMADYLFSLQRYDQAVVPYTTLWDESKEPVVGLRLAETLIRLKRWGDAEKIITGLDESAQQSVEMYLLRAEVHIGRGEDREAFSLLNQAVAAGPANPVPFLRRAQFNMKDPNLYADVLADLEQVLRLSPNLIIARQMRASLLISRGRIAEALGELRKAAQTDPDNKDLQRLYVLQLVSTKNWTDAFTAVDASVQRFKSADWFALGGQVYLEASLSPDNARNSNTLLQQAYEYFRQTHLLEQSATSGIRLAMTALEVDPPKAQEALSALEELDTDMLNNNTRLLLLRARSLNAMGDRSGALDDLRNALRVATASDEVKLWFVEVNGIFDTQTDILRFVEEQTPPEILALHFEVQATRLRSVDISRRSELIEFLLLAETQAADDDSLLIDILRLRGALEYQAGSFVAATESMSKGVELAPQDLEFNNNLAYLLVKEKKDFAAALAPAQRAAEIAANNPIVLDTLGWVLYNNSQIARAESTLQRALNLSNLPNQEVPINIHLGLVKLAQDDVRTSRRFADRASELIRRSPELADDFQTDLNDLIQSLEQAEETAGLQQ